MLNIRRNEYNAFYTSPYTEAGSFFHVLKLCNDEEGLAFLVIFENDLGDELYVVTQLISEHVYNHIDRFLRVQITGFHCPDAQVISLGV